MVRKSGISPTGNFWKRVVRITSMGWIRGTSVAKFAVQRLAKIPYRFGHRYASGGPRFRCLWLLGGTSRGMEELGGLYAWTRIFNAVLQ